MSFKVNTELLKKFHFALSLCLHLESDIKTVLIGDHIQTFFSLFLKMLMKCRHDFINVLNIKVKCIIHFTF